MSNKIVQSFYKSLSKSLSPNISALYLEDFETVKPHSFDKLSERFVNEYDLYLKTLIKQEEYLHLYRVGIKRDDGEWMENLANKVGLTTLPKK